MKNKILLNHIPANEFSAELFHTTDSREYQ